MKHNYRKNMKTKLTFLTVLLFSITITQAQNIKFTFMNAVNTNDGSNDFYEADILIETNGVADFNVGSGQLYFNYNEAAFGPNIEDNNKVVITQATGSLGNGSGDGYICGQLNNGFAPVYGGYVLNDNTTSRLSWSFRQVFSTSTFTGNNVIASPRKLIHIKIEYTDVNQAPMVEFEDDNSVLSQVGDQFFSACGDDGSGSGNFILADCTNFAGNQFLNAVFENSNAVLSVKGYNEIAINKITIYPNPATDFININSTIEINKVELYDLLGKQVISTNQTSGINVSHLPIGVYILKLYAKNGITSRKIIIE